MDINIEIGKLYEDGARVSRVGERWDVFTYEGATRATIVAVRAAIDLLLAMATDEDEEAEGGAHGGAAMTSWHEQADRLGHSDDCERCIACRIEETLS